MNKEYIVHPAMHPIEDPDTLNEEAFMEFVFQHDFTAPQVRAAYEELMGVTDTPSADPSIRQILEEMRRMEAEHFPVNRFVKFINDLSLIEETVPMYVQYVESLPVSLNEKRMLRSLVDKQRPGRLSVMVDGEEINELILGGGSPGEEEVIAAELLDALNKILGDTTGRQVEFIFSPE